MNPSGSHILVVNSQPILREGIVAVFTAALMGAIITGIGSFPEALALIAKTPIDLVVATFRVQGDTALSFLHELKDSGSTTRCLILSSLDEIQIGYPCMLAGASGFVKKSSPVSDVVDAVRMVLAGNHYASEQLSKALMDRPGPESIASAGTHLTASELRIFTMIGGCMTVSAIAANASRVRNA